ncbi:cytochrome d ubiquinol oxidase subunit II [Tengunoibacter tsumagoiensis]|uniref:Cytochrome c oxidase assembly protein n=1 Tax=Tengunoibacter tsumagoiensis TaxID=2014871 RepID=A0A402A3C4_9CHLR|nr:cytochrome d ubiquinol oxidase subunit II [Tengunoibacter tsumagoiensis]GCE13491.1 cytochrome c oxidase assembly protein [Tengunoibacter tsumagoiensis]
MDLNAFWFVLITILFIGFFFLEGFDYGVGMLLPFLGRTDKERQLLIRSIGPFWDGNEVWLLTAGGALFAAFPNWYATLFSGFYLALLLMLVALIVRAVAFEFRNRDEHAEWRRLWDWMIFVGSALPGFLWGVAITNIIEGVPIDARMNYVGGFWNLLNPYALLGGSAFVSLFLLHGAIFLSLRTQGEMLERSHQVTRKVWWPAAVLVFLFVIIGYFTTDVFGRLGVDPGVAPLGAGMALLLAGWFVYARRSGWAFAMTGVTIALSTLTIFMGLFPRVMISSLDTHWNLTIYNASSSPYTLTVMSIVALTFVPVVLVYQGWNYWVFRHRLTAESSGHL